MKQVSDLVQLFLLLSYGFCSDLFLLSNLVINCLRLCNFLFTFILTFTVLFLLGNDLGNSVFIFVQIVEGVLG